MSIAAIPLYLLRHSAQLVTEYQAGKWGKGVVLSQDLYNVRIVPCHRVRYSITADMPEITAKLFFDVRNSRPMRSDTDYYFYPFKLCGDTDNNGVVERQKVIFMEKEYLVSKIDSYFDDDTLHHLEVMLS